MRRIAIVGGGMAGLSAAFALEKHRRAGAALEYLLVESSARLGGVIRTEHVDGCLVEAGPDSFVSEKPWAADLCRELGLADQLIGSNDAQRRTYMLVKSRLIPLPEGMMFMVPTRPASALLSPLFSPTTKLRMVREWFYRPRAEDLEASIAEFIERHYGREMVERIADPLLAGIYGAGAEELGTNAVLSRLARIEREWGSLSRGLMRAAKAGGAGDRPLFTSLKQGMQQITDSVRRALPREACRMDSTVEAVVRESSKWLLVSSGPRTEEFDAVIVATPAACASQLIAASNPELGSELNAIRYSSSLVVVLGYGSEVRRRLPPGFGLLIPRRENSRLLAVTFVHNKFSGRAPEDRALLRCFLGGSRGGEVIEWSDDDIQSQVRRELARVLHVEEEPRFVKIYRWRRSMAIYGVGHGQRIERIQRLVSGLPGLALAGNAYGGIGVPDCVRTGNEAASKLIAELGLLPAVRIAGNNIEVR